MTNFVEFWPFYVREHNSPLNRRLHFIGTLLAMMSLGWGLATMNPLCFLLTPVFGYSFAWIGAHELETFHISNLYAGLP